MAAIVILSRGERADVGWPGDSLACLPRSSTRGPSSPPSLGDGVFELKTPRGFRLIYFFGPRRTIVCGNLCRKPKPRELRQIARRAQDLRKAYIAASDSGDIVVEIGG